MAKCLIEFAPSIIGKIIDDFEWDYSNKFSDGSVVSTSGSTLQELGNGCYLIDNPNVTEDTLFRIHLTTDVNIYTTGTITLSDGNIARQSTLNNIPEEMWLYTSRSLTDKSNFSGIATNMVNAPDNNNISVILSTLQDASYGLDSLLTAINTRLSSASYDAPNNADIISIKNDIRSTSFGLNALLAIINTKLSTNDYVAPDNTSIATIKNKTNLLNFTDNKVDANATINLDLTPLATTQQLNQTTTTILENLGVFVDGSVPISHDFPTQDNLRYVDETGSGIDNASIVVYLKEDYVLNKKSKTFIKGSSSTRSDGRWSSPIYLDSGMIYVVEFYKQGEYTISSKEITT